MFPWSFMFDLGNYYCCFCTMWRNNHFRQVFITYNSSLRPWNNDRIKPNEDPRSSARKNGDAVEKLLDQWYKKSCCWRLEYVEWHRVSTAVERTDSGNYSRNRRNTYIIKSLINDSYKFNEYRSNFLSEIVKIINKEKWKEAHAEKVWSSCWFCRQNIDKSISKCTGTIYSRGI